MTSAASGSGAELEPILVIGTHRSGTEMLARSLAAHPDVTYWEEPRHVWSWRHNYRRDDVLGEEDATVAVVSHVRRAFARRLARSGRSRLIEKTPSNCLRLPFVARIFPRAHYVHIVRDGRAVVTSTERVMTSRFPAGRFLLPRLLGTPVWEWPALVPRAWRSLGRRLLGRDMSFWGPRPPGWRAWLRQDPQPVVLARQWRRSIEPVLAFGERIPAARWTEVRYEGFVAEPQREIARILGRVGLAPCVAVFDELRQRIDPDRRELWRDQLDEATLEELRPILEAPLRRLGYSWEPTAAGVRSTQLRSGS